MSPTDNDMYEILGLEPGASWDEIRAAYRRLVKKHHPDKNLGDPASEWFFKQVNQAYELLQDIHGLEEAEGPRSTRRGPEGERDREQREPQRQTTPDDPREQVPKSAARGKEESRKERRPTESKPLRSLRPGWRWRVEDVDWERFRRNPPEWYLAYLRDLHRARQRARQPHRIWRILRTVVLASFWAYAGIILLIFLSVLLGPLFGIHL